MDLWLSLGYKPKAMALKLKNKKDDDSRPHRWHIPVILALGKQEEEDQDFKVILSYTVSSRLAWGQKTFPWFSPFSLSFSRQGFSV